MNYILNKKKQTNNYMEDIHYLTVMTLSVGVEIIHTKYCSRGYFRSYVFITIPQQPIKLFVHLLIQI